MMTVGCLRIAVRRTWSSSAGYLHPRARLRSPPDHLAAQFMTTCVPSGVVTSSRNALTNSFWIDVSCSRYSCASRELIRTHSFFEQICRRRDRRRDKSAAAARSPSKLTFARRSTVVSRVTSPGILVYSLGFLDIFSSSFSRSSVTSSMNPEGHS